jgi:hypothetical protein
VTTHEIRNVNPAAPDVVCRRKQCYQEENQTISRYAEDPARTVGFIPIAHALRMKKSDIGGISEVDLV